MNVTIYHNPRCSKSRATLELIRSKGSEPIIIEYLKTPPSVTELDEILNKLGIGPRELMRKSEEVYKEAGLDNPALDRQALIAAMAQHPILIERPIVLAQGTAVIGRPPEKVLEIL